MESVPEDVRFIPEDGICPTCSRLVRDHPGVNRVLAARGFMHYDEDNDKYIYTTGVQRCACEATTMERERQYEFMANLPLSVKGPMPRSFIAGTFENFAERAGAEEAYAVCMDFVNENTEPILVLRGPRGTGKTHLMEAVGREMLARGKTVRYERIPTLLGRMRSAFNSEHQGVLEERNAQYRDVAELLMLDDLDEVNYPTPEIELRRLGIRYTLSGNKNKPIEKVFKPIDKSDDFYRKFDDVVNRYGLSNSVVIQNKANLSSLNQEGTCGYDTDARTGRKLKTPGGLK